MKTVAIVCTLLTLPAMAPAAPIAAWEVTGIKLSDHEPPYLVAAHTSDTHLAAASLTLSASVNPSTYSNQYGFKISASASNASLEEAIADAHYLALTLTATDNHAMDLASLEMYGMSTATGCDKVALLSSVDGFSVSNVIAALSGIADKAGGLDTDESGFGGPIDLAAPQYSNLKSIEFRLYGWDSSHPNGSTALRDHSGFELVVHGRVRRLGSLLFVQ
jgi:hypothetical protein